jgi:hypothetical protein
MNHDTDAPGVTGIPARFADALARRGVPFSLDVGGAPVRWRFHLGGRSVLEVGEDGAAVWRSALPVYPAALPRLVAAAAREAGLS